MQEKWNVLVLKNQSINLFSQDQIMYIKNKFHLTFLTCLSQHSSDVWCQLLIFLRILFIANIKDQYTEYNKSNKNICIKKVVWNAI